ncbi:hypothetical protein DK389_09765 [Methylobacterium durans]|uniref:Uncharacterized protein n=2 Tax=Methylobacterium durans TaxID=2202825 RepID=A0A2U8W5H5_9HYPH|nr:hypothetical protein DK389_09765 [Methylobacterium durans]
MTPATRCSRTIEHLSALTTSDVAHRVVQALDELEDAYPDRSDRVIAMEDVLQTFVRSRAGKERKAPFARFVYVTINRRLSVVR